MGAKGSDLKAETERLVEIAVAAGWRVLEGNGTGRKRTSKHWRLAPPDRDQPIVVTPRTPSDHRGPKNFRSQLRRQGLEV